MAQILVIEDDAEVRALLERMLKSAGHEVILAADGREGVGRYLSKAAGMVITDLYTSVAIVQTQLFRAPT